ncbi:transcriptional regulator, partial [bacterium]|nr:transcriptional regulator [bacterium]
RKLALEIRALEKAAARDEAALAERRLAFERDHGRLPPPEVAARDYSSFTEEQRALVVALLVAGRFRLAHAARTREGRPLLLTHASLGTRELEIASVPVERDADAIARALNGWLDRAVRRAKTSWEKDELAPLDLAPLHVFGARGREGGGLLYHRPSNPERPGARPLWEASDLAPRRFDARELPLGLLQACGHTSHRKCLKDLEGWLAPGVGELSRGALRTLRTDGSRVSYDGGLGAVPEREAGLYFLDSSMKFVDPPAYRLLELSAALA